MDFKNMSKQEIIEYAMASEENKSHFAEVFCKSITNDITNFFEKNPEKTQAFIHIFTSDDIDEFKYVIDLDANSYPDTLCVILTIGSVNSNNQSEVVVEDKSN